MHSELRKMEHVVHEILGRRIKNGVVCNPTGGRIKKCAALLLRDVEMKYKRKGRYVFTSSQVEELVVVIIIVVVVSS